MNEPTQLPEKAGSFQVSISSLTLGSLYEAVLAFSSQDSFETLWPSVCQNVRWLIPSRRMGILLCTMEENFEIAGMFERGNFQKPVDSLFTPEGEELKYALAQKNAQWIRSPRHPTVGETSHFTRWLLQDTPDALLVLPMRVKGKTIGALLFAMASVEDRQGDVDDPRHHLRAAHRDGLHSAPDQSREEGDAGSFDPTREDGLSGKLGSRHYA